MRFEEMATKPAPDAITAEVGASETDTNDADSIVVTGKRAEAEETAVGAIQPSAPVVTSTLPPASTQTPPPAPVIERAPAPVVTNNLSLMQRRKGRAGLTLSVIC